MPRKKRSNRTHVENTQETGGTTASFNYTLTSQATPPNLKLRNNEAKASIEKIANFLSTHKNCDRQSLEESLEPDINILRREIISSNIRIDLLLSNKTKLSELEDKNNNLQEQHKSELKRLSESLNNYRTSVANQVKLLENMSEQAKKHETDIENYQLEIKNNQSKIDELLCENKALKTDLQKAREELENLKTIGDEMSAQIGELSI